VTRLEAPELRQSTSTVVSAVIARRRDGSAAAGPWIPINCLRDPVIECRMWVSSHPRSSRLSSRSGPVWTAHRIVLRPPRDGAALLPSFRIQQRYLFLLCSFFHELIVRRMVDLEILHDFQP